MFGSGDDKNSKQPADNADSQSPEEQQNAAASEKPARKGLFSWFGRKKSEAKTEPASPVETTPAEAVEQAELPEGNAAEAEKKPAPVAEQSADVAEPVEAVVSSTAQQTAEQTPVASAESVEPATELQQPVVTSEPTQTAEQAAMEDTDPVLEANLAGQSKPQDNKKGWFARLRQGLAKTSSSLGEGMASLFLGKKEIDDDLMEELETRLLTADVGMEATTAIMDNLTRRVARKELADSGALYKALQVEMVELLRPVEQPLTISSGTKPYVILVVGVNGAGKTTTIGKLASRLQKDGKKVMLAAGDTFRAAAVEQLQVWGERNKIPVIAQHTGADSASVIFDAVQAAQSRGIDVLIADTAGRLHTKDNLMEELRKVARVMGRLDEHAPHEVLLVLDAGTGQNAINQTRQFNETIPVTGLALTKLDGTAKGGVIFALAKHFQTPVRFIGVGEGIDDLRDFVADDFVEALFAEKDSA
ncbi:MAG TPA: signal recognition particle-docking protein FtsY [Thiopseudomonas sp.]|nr:signal recognition particle-docking protein FtsY [Thiopseudomonas sp.]